MQLEREFVQTVDKHGVHSATAAHQVKRLFLRLNHNPDTLFGSVKMHTRIMSICIVVGHKLKINVFVDLVVLYLSIASILIKFLKAYF